MSYRRRTRMISFRVSENEFEQLRTMSESLGAGSVSDYARLSLCRAQQPPSDGIDSTIRKLDDELLQVRTHLERLTTLVERTHHAVMAGNGHRKNDVELPRKIDSCSAELDSGLVKSARLD